MEIKIEKFIKDNGLFIVVNSPWKDDLCLWECAGGHLWTWDMILDAVKIS